MQQKTGLQDQVFLRFVVWTFVHPWSQSGAADAVLLFLVQICKNTSSIIEIMTKLDGSPGMVAKKSPVKHHAIYGIRYANDDSACCLLMSLWFFFLKCFLGKQVFSPICYHFYVL